MHRQTKYSCNKNLFSFWCILMYFDVKVFAWFGQDLAPTGSSRVNRSTSAQLCQGSCSLLAQHGTHVCTIKNVPWVFQLYWIYVSYFSVDNSMLYYHHDTNKPPIISFEIFRHKAISTKHFVHPSFLPLWQLFYWVAITH